MQLHIYTVDPCKDYHFMLNINALAIFFLDCSDTKEAGEWSKLCVKQDDMWLSGLSLNFRRKWFVF